MSDEFVPEKNREIIIPGEITQFLHKFDNSLALYILLHKYEILDGPRAGLVEVFAKDAAEELKWNKRMVSRELIKLEEIGMLKTVRGSHNQYTPLLVKILINKQERCLSEEKVTKKPNKHKDKVNTGDVKSDIINTYGTPKNPSDTKYRGKSKRQKKKKSKPKAVYSIDSSGVEPNEKIHSAYVKDIMAEIKALEEDDLLRENLGNLNKSSMTKAMVGRIVDISAVVKGWQLFHKKIRMIRTPTLTKIRSVLNHYTVEEIVKTMSLT